MDIKTFIAVGENIHCTRILKVGGKSVRTEENGAAVIDYTSGDKKRTLAVPSVFTDGADWQNGKVRHCAVAIWQGLNGDSEGQSAGADYLRSLARKQEAHGAAWLDVNVDEYSPDIDERARAMKWAVPVVQEAVRVPISVDSSAPEALEAGLESCLQERGQPLVNSVSLERPESIALARRFRACVIASAAGTAGLPSTAQERIVNLEQLIPMLKEAGLSLGEIHVDPLVLPISVDSQNGQRFLEAVRAVRERFGTEIHIVAGLSNVSFGMPRRSLINRVFSWLAVEAGADGGIVDPAQINLEALRSMDTSSEGFQHARALLLGEDEFGMEYISACREGKI